MNWTASSKSVLEKVWSLTLTVSGFFNNKTTFYYFTVNFLSEYNGFWALINRRELQMIVFILRNNQSFSLIF